MSEPIIEQITQWLVAALTEITQANGYQQDLAVKRPEDTYLDSESVTDLTTMVAQGACEPDQSGTMEELFWKQTFEISIFFCPVPGASLSLDTRINRAVSDVYKRLGVELAAIRTNHGRLCDELAYRFDFEGVEIGIVESLAATVATVLVTVAYTVNRTDPYVQTS